MSYPNYPYTNNIPNPVHIPAIDVPNMQTNSNSISGIWTSDHVGFGVSGSGYHTKVTIFDETTPATPVDPVSIIYTQPGSAAPQAELVYTNANGPTLLNGIKAFGSFAYNGSSFGNQSNCTALSISVVGGTATATITITSGIVSGSNAIVIVQSSITSVLKSYAFSNPTLTITYGAGIPCALEFVILQA